MSHGYEQRPYMFIVEKTREKALERFKEELDKDGLEYEEITVESIELKLNLKLGGDEVSQQGQAMASIESKALRFSELNDTIARHQEEKELIKGTVEQMMKEEHMNELRVGLDGTYDVKVTVGEKRSRKVDYEQLATDLGVSIESAKSKETLIKAVQEGKLTLEQFENYKYDDIQPSVSIRKVKAL